MNTAILSLILDFVVLAALVGTIYFALRLSSSLNNFRKHRNEMKTLIAELSKNINEAQSAIEGLKATSNIAANNLDDVLHDSRRMAEELKMINETSDNIANRLEKLATGAPSYESADDFEESDYEEEEYYDDMEAANTDSRNPEPPSFFIQDREFDDKNVGENASAAPDSGTFVSEAEKELLQALQGRKKSGRG
ncbi:MAG: DUF6468 domain-containing protein [Alphaproteobacteria bacterium]